MMNWMQRRYMEKEEKSRNIVALHDERQPHGIFGCGLSARHICYNFGKQLLSLRLLTNSIHYFNVHFIFKDVSVMFLSTVNGQVCWNYDIFST